MSNPSVLRWEVVGGIRGGGALMEAVPSHNRMIWDLGAGIVSGVCPRVQHLTASYVSVYICWLFFTYCRIMCGARVNYALGARLGAVL